MGTKLTSVIAAAALVAALAAADAGAVVVDRHAGLEAGTLAEFDSVGAEGGALTIRAGLAAAGSYSASASYTTGGANGYARGIFETAWAPGDEVTYSAAFYLPPGFHDSMQGQVALLRWDNWPSYGSPGGDVGGVVIYGSDRGARLVRGRYGGEQVPLVGPFRLPEGRWFTLAVAQRLSPEAPYSQVWVDGESVGSSAAPNSYGRVVERLRVGLVSISAGAQRNPLSLHFDEARIASGLVAPAGGAPTAPAPKSPPGAAGDQAPRVRLTNPHDRDRFRRKLRVAARATDDVGIDRVEFIVDGKVVRSDRRPPYTWTWRRGATRLGLGRHTVTAVAYDGGGRRDSSSAEVRRVRKRGHGGRRP